ncbi:hypothetical protein RCL1_001040 [Eukaryota sp. TZLM3-RCL]
MQCGPNFQQISGPLFELVLSRADVKVRKRMTMDYVDDRSVVGSNDGDLLSLLISLRSKLCEHETHIRPQHICSFDMLRRLARLKPREMDGFQKITTWAPSKLNKYGQYFLDVILQYLDPCYEPVATIKPPPTTTTAIVDLVSPVHDSSCFVLSPGQSRPEQAGTKRLSPISFVDHVPLKIGHSSSPSLLDDIFDN